MSAPEHAVVVPLLPPLTRDNMWTCRICGLHWVVPALARCCEDKDAVRFG